MDKIAEWIVLEVHPWCPAGQDLNLGVASKADLVPSPQSTSSRHRAMGNRRIKGLEGWNHRLKLGNWYLLKTTSEKEHFRSGRRRRSHGVAVKLFCSLLKLLHLMLRAFPVHPCSVAWSWTHTPACEASNRLVSACQLPPTASETLSAPEKGYKVWEICP